MQINYINTDTKIDSGLFRSQVKVLYGSCPNHYNFNCINIKTPFQKSSKNFKEITGWPMRYSNNILWLIPLIFSSMLIAEFLKKDSKHDVYVARGYYGGLIGYFLSKSGCNFIWDPRSIYPLEEMGAGKFTKKSLSFAAWLLLEKKILRSCNGVIVVSDGHGKYYRRFTERNYKYKTPQFLVPCYAEQYQYETYAEDIAEDILSKLDKNLPRVVYSGSLDDKWNKLSLYLPVFKELLLKKNNLIILTQSNVKKTILEYVKYDDNRLEINNQNRLIIKNIPDTDVHSAILRKSDWGLMIMGRVPDWYSRLSVKFAMYRCAGLRVIITKFFGGALSTLKKNKDESYIVLDRKYESLNFINITDSNTKEIIKDTSINTFNPANFFKAIDFFEKSLSKRNV